MWQAINFICCIVCCCLNKRGNYFPEVLSWEHSSVLIRRSQQRWLQYSSKTNQKSEFRRRFFKVKSSNTRVAQVVGVAPRQSRPPACMRTVWIWQKSKTNLLQETEPNQIQTTGSSGKSLKLTQEKSSEPAHSMKRRRLILGQRVLNCTCYMA